MGFYLGLYDSINQYKNIPRRAPTNNNMEDKVNSGYTAFETTSGLRNLMNPKMVANIRTAKCKTTIFPGYLNFSFCIV